MLITTFLLFLTLAFIALVAHIGLGVTINPCEDAKKELESRVRLPESLQDYYSSNR